MTWQFLEKPSDYSSGSQVNQDDLWKKIIADLFEDFLLFFIPEFHAEVDFSKPVDFLQQELFKEIIDERKGRKMADQIAKVYLKNGEEQWVLVHTEVQSEDHKGFPLRMFEYYYRIFDRYSKKIVAIALFSNTSKKSSNQYKEVYFGTEVSYTFNKFVIADFDEEMLKGSPKLFSKALLASIYMQRTQSEMGLRSDFKRALLRDVLSLENVSRTEISALLYFVDYLLKLPEEMAERLKQELRLVIRKEVVPMHQFHKDELPPTLAGVLELERREWMEQGLEQGIEKGMEQGIEQGIERGIEQGIEKGIELGIRQMVLRLFEKGFAEDVIADIAKIPVEQVQKMKENG